jgi:hypothetical protein
MALQGTQEYIIRSFFWKGGEDAKSEHCMPSCVGGRLQANNLWWVGSSELEANKHGIAFALVLAC